MNKLWLIPITIYFLSALSTIYGYKVDSELANQGRYIPYEDRSDFLIISSAALSGNKDVIEAISNEEQGKQLPKGELDFWAWYRSYNIEPGGFGFLPHSIALIITLTLIMVMIINGFVFLTKKKPSGWIN